jgi:small conductance mechanosensitive channel
MVKDLLAGYPAWAAGTIAVAAALAAAYLVAEAAARLVRLVFLGIVRSDGTTTFTTPIVRRPIRAVRLTVFIVVSIILLFPAMKVAGLDMHLGYEPEAVIAWLLASGVRVVIIIALAMIVMRATSAALKRLEEDVTDRDTLDALERARRVRTLGALIENVVGTFAIATAMLMILRELHVDVMPLLTGAGIAGLAIGFGAQSLVKDVISGFFMILENQIRVGDVALINGVGGAVEAVRLRTITLRDVEGTVHVFPNGSISTLANRTKDYSFAVLDVSVAYKEDTDRVVDVLRRVGADLYESPDFAGSLLEPLEIFGVDGFAESAVTIKIRFKTLPLKQWQVARELRRRIKQRFDAEGIEIPFPHRTLQLVGASPVPAGAIPPGQ